MKRISSKLSILLILFIVSAFSISSASEWQVIEDSSNVRFIYSLEGAAFRGRFDLFSAKINFDKNNRVWLNGEDVSNLIRTVDISSKVSMVSAIREVRNKMVEIQRSIAGDNDCVLEGRDIGTVVFPEAEYKFFLIADIIVRAKRRLSELKNSDQIITLDQIIANIRNRDELDSSRQHSPLQRAKDAILIDTSHITIEQQVEKIVEIVNQQ